MTNILPSDALREVTSHRRARVVLTASASALVGAFFAFAALLPNLIDLYILRPPLGDTSPQTSSEAASDRGEIQRAQAILAHFSETASTTPALEGLKKALEVRPKGTTVRLIRFLKEAETTTIVLEGNANRGNVTAYRNALISSAYFKTVSVPPEAFAEAEGGRFIMTLTGDF